MCSNQTVPSVSLQTAVLMQVTEFAKNNQPFSIYDITDALRLNVNSGDLEIPEIEERGPTFRFNVRHSRVRSIFREMLNTGMFDPSFKLEETFPNGKFFVYVPTVISMTSATQQPPMTSATTVAPPFSVAAPFAKPTRDEIVKRVKLYLNRCEARNFRPTLKQTQSAIKRNASTGISCESLMDIVQSLGYPVLDVPDSVSRAKVVTV